MVKSNFWELTSTLILGVVLAFITNLIKNAIYQDTFFGISGNALEFPLIAAFLGLLVNVVLRISGNYKYIKPNLHSEFFLKLGLVALGASINLGVLLSSASLAVIQSLIMVISVFYFSWWLGGKMGLSDKLRAVMSAALSICGVSAAIAAASAVQAKKEETTYVSALVIVVALPMMVIMPFLAHKMGLSQMVAGAWFGGNIDTTAAVVGAGTIYGETAQEIASVVKGTQNTLIGVATFLLALYFSMQPSDNKSKKPKLSLILTRFPKFVLGFIIASILYSLGWIDGSRGTVIASIKDWLFIIAFVFMGLELSFKELKEMGWKPLTVFLTATVFNTSLALIMALFLFGSL